jgi:serine/threonine-protein kinase
MVQSDLKKSFLDRGATAVATQMLAQDEQLPVDSIGPYRLQKKLGAGGMGVVYLAERDDWHSIVAVKIPRDIWISNDQLRRFAEEQRVLARLVHPSIARIYEGGTLANGTPWFAMEYVDGVPISKHCQTRGLNTRQILELFQAVCDAVQYAHTQAIIHRDLKPSNILVTPAGEVKLLDFGIAKQIGDAVELATQTRTGLQPVTLAYAAPEQVLKNQISTQTDVYALGVILYELLTGRLPLDMTGLTLSQAEEMIRTREPQKPFTVAGQSDLNVLTLTAMHKDTAKRYGSVDALKRDINHYLKNEALEAHGDTVSYRLGKFVRRRRLPILFAAAAMAVIVSLVTFYTVRLAKARDAALAEAARTRAARQLTQDLFAGDREYGPSKDLRVVDLLDPGLEKARSLKGDPVQRGELYATLGTLFRSQAKYDKAESALNAAYRILSSASPGSHELAEVLVSLGKLYSDESRGGDAERYLRKGLALEESITPNDKALIFKYKTMLAEAMLDSKPGESLSILNAQLKEPSSVANDDAWSDVWTDVTTAYMNTGQYKEAEPFALRVLAYDRHSRWVNTPSMATDLVNLGYLERYEHRYAASEQDFRSALAIDQAFYPKGHPEPADVMRLLAETLYMEGRFKEAEPLARQALIDERKAYGDMHERVGSALHVLARLSLQQGHLDEAESDFRKEVIILQVQNDVTMLPGVYGYLGDIYLKKKLYDQSERAYRKAIELYPSSAARRPEHLAQTNRKLGELFLAQGRFADAKGPLQASYKYFSAQHGANSEELTLLDKDLARLPH